MTDTSGHDADLERTLRLIDRLGRQRFTIHEFTIERGSQEVVAAKHGWGDIADVVILIDQRQACGYRTPLGDAQGRETDVFDPEAVYCWFTGGPAWTIRALLELPQPAHPHAPRKLIAAPGIFRFPKHIRRSERIRRRWS